MVSQKRQGRPRADDGMGRKRHPIYFTEEEWAKIEQAARRVGDAPGVFVRKAANLLAENQAGRLSDSRLLGGDMGRLDRDERDKLLGELLQAAANIVKAR